jgi:hypothetical protein
MVPSPKANLSWIDEILFDNSHLYNNLFGTHNQINCHDLCISRALTIPVDFRVLIFRFLWELSAGMQVACVSTWVYLFPFHFLIHTCLSTYTCHFVLLYKPMDIIHSSLVCGSTRLPAHSLVHPSLHFLSSF